MTGVAIPRDAWDLDRVPAHLRPTYRVEDAAGERLAEGKDLPALQAALKVEVRKAVARVGAELERDDVRAWDFGTLPKTVDGVVDGHAVRGYPALVDEERKVAGPRAGQRRRAGPSHAGRDPRLLWRGRAVGVATGRELPRQQDRARAGHNPHGRVPALFADVTAAALDAVVTASGGPAWDAAGFAALRAAVRERAADEFVPILRRVAAILALSHEIEMAVHGTDAARRWPPSVADIRGQLAT